MKVEDDIFFSRFSFFLLPLLSEEYLNHRNSKSIGPRWDWYVNFLFLKDSHPENLIRIPSQRLQHGHKQPTTNNCIQQLFYNYNNNIQTRNQPPDTNHQITSREFLHTHTHTHTKLRRSGVRGLCLPNGWSAPTISGDGTVSWLGTADDETEQSRGVQRPKKSWKPDEPDEWPGNYMYI